MATKPPKTKAKGNIEVGERFERELPCPINKATADRKRDEVLHVLDDIDEQQAMMKPYRMKIAELHEQKRALREDIHSMTEKRKVKCVEERDYSKREVRVVRLDTRATVESRPMTDDDRQEEIEDLVPAAKRLRGIAKDEGEKRDAEKAGKGRGRTKLKSVPPTPGEAIAQARANGTGNTDEQDEERVRAERREMDDDLDGEKQSQEDESL